MFDNWMLTKYLNLVHFNHTLNKTISTPVTFYQEAAPLILLRTGDDYAKDTPFLTYIMNFIEFIYMYSLLYF